VGLFTRRRATAQEPAATRPVRPLTAAGLRLDGLSTDAVRAIASTRKDWQAHAWGYRDAIGELRGGVQFLARAVSRVLFLPAEVNREADEAIPFDSKLSTLPEAVKRAAREELARLPLESGYSFLGVLVENISYPGEAWLHGYADELTGDERWAIRSIDEVEITNDGRVTVTDGPIKREVRVNLSDRPDQDGDEELLRLWTPHPRRRWEADSPMRALLDVCEEIVLSGMELRAASRSRVAANGILLVPQGMSLLNALRQDRSLAQDDEFMADLQATLLAPIGNEGEAGAVVPAVIQGDLEDLQAVRHLRLERTTSGELLDRLERCLKRLGAGMDIPPEIISGLSDANHWTAWQIDNSTYRHHIDPMVRVVADALTEAFLRPALLARGIPAELVGRVQVWYDASGLTENPNRGQDAKDAFDRGALGFVPLLEALGFSESDAPTDEELARIIAMRAGVDSNVATAILAGLLGSRVPEPQVVEGGTGGNAPALPPAEDDRPAGGSPGNGPTQTTPEQNAQRGTALAAALVAAVATRLDKPDETLAAGWDVDVDAARELIDVDRALRDRLLVAADAALARALEKAGARTRSLAQRNPALRSKLVNVPPTLAVARIGRDGLLALGVSERELLEDAFTGLRSKWDGWVASAIGKVADLVSRLLGVDVRDRVSTEMTERMPGAWDRFHAALMGTAERVLHQPDGGDEQGEVSGLLVRTSTVRAALAYVGGLDPQSSGIAPDDLFVDADEPLGGLGNGQTVRDTMEDNGALELGFEWAYGITPELRRFDPHWALNKRRFTGWEDPELATGPKYSWVGPYFTPGDHHGCACDYVPLWAVEAHEEETTAGLAEDSPAMADVRRLAEADDAAGRKGTTAQRDRDERDRIKALQARWIKGGAAE
jgi:hypothetical protein